MSSAEPTNEECGEIGRKALEAVGFPIENYDDLSTSIYDLVADLLHLARLNDIEPDFVIEMAQEHYQAEVEEEAEAAKLEQEGVGDAKI